MDSALSAASLLLAVVAMLFSAWQSEISAALSLKPSSDASKTTRSKDQALSTLKSKARPLAIGATLAAAVFSFRAIGIAASLRFIGTPGYCFDDIGAAFVLTELFIVLIAVIAIGHVRDLKATVANLKS